MKVFSKRQMLGISLSKFLQIEKKVMINFEHPFLVKMHACFQSDKQLYILMDYCEKGDVGRYLETTQTLTESKAKILISELVLAVEALHNQNILHRDIKPENILVTASGHIKLGDFGLCKELKPDQSLTNTYCGSIAYLAPEIVAREGHGKAVDWYLVGEVLYELLYGQPPYFSSCKQELMQKIKTAEL